MKITAEFNSNEELISFIGAFGTSTMGAEAKQDITPVVETKKTTKVETIKKEDKPVKETKTDAPKEDVTPSKEETKAEDPKVTKEMVRERLGLIMKAGKQAEVKALVAKHGAGKLPDLKEDEYAAVYKEAEELI